MLKKLKTWISRKKIKAVIFDYDGVLNDSLDIIRQLYNELHRRGITNLHFKDNKEFSNFFQGDLYKNIEAAGMELTAKNIKINDAVTKEFLSEADPNAKLFFGISSLLQNLKSEGYKLGIASNGNKVLIESKLANYYLENTIDSIVGYEEVNEPKPNPEGLLKCLKELNVKPKEALYVGDMESDVQASKAAGIKIIAVTYGFLHLKEDKEELLKDADMLAHTVDEIYERIKHG